PACSPSRVPSSYSGSSRACWLEPSPPPPGAIFPDLPRGFTVSEGGRGVTMGRAVPRCTKAGMFGRRGAARDGGAGGPGGRGGRGNPQVGRRDHRLLVSSTHPFLLYPGGVPRSPGTVGLLHRRFRGRRHDGRTHPRKSGTGFSRAGGPAGPG